MKKVFLMVVGFCGLLVVFSLDLQASEKGGWEREVYFSPLILAHHFTGDRENHYNENYLGSFGLELDFRDGDSKWSFGAMGLYMPEDSYRETAFMIGPRIAYRFLESFVDLDIVLAVPYTSKYLGHPSRHDKYRGLLALPLLSISKSFEDDFMGIDGLGLDIGYVPSHDDDMIFAGLKFRF